MTIFGFAKYLAIRLIEQPSVKDGAKPYAPNAGNIFFALFAAVGMVGAVGYGFNSVLRGPVSAMTETTRRTVAESTVITSSRIAIVGATTQQTGAGDTDDDGFIEPVPYRDAATAPHPAGGGYLPTALNIPDTVDPWKTEYGYCAWDHGSITASSRRLAGSPNNNRFALAIISAGKDRTFQTSCIAYVDDTTTLIQRTPGSDDIVLAYTYAEANDLGNGLWKPHATAPNTAMTDKNIDVTGGGIVSGGVVLSGNTATGGGLILPSDPGDDSISGACDAMNDNQLRYNVSDPLEAPVIEICDHGGLGWSPVSGGASSGGGTTGELVAHYKFDETTGTTAADELGAHDGTLFNTPTWMPGQGRIDGAIALANASQEYVRVPTDPALQPTAVTISAWVKRDGAQTTSAGILNKYHSVHSLSYGLQFFGTNDDILAFYIGHGSGGTNLSGDVITTTSLASGRWYHIIASYDPAGTAPQVRLYVNGVLEGSTTETRNINYGVSAGDLYIGSNNTGTQYMNGQLDDVRIYNYQMTNEEALALYNLVNPTNLNLDAPKKAGAIYSWGEDTHGGLGNGAAETASRGAPGPIESTATYIDVSAGPDGACAIKSDGTAWCWGEDGSGKLGNGSGVTASQPAPYQVTGLSNMVKISAGQTHACALRNDGAVFCWGNNTLGKLGDGTVTLRESPVQVVGLANAIDISAGYHSTCAVVADGGAWCWGRGTEGQLGNGLSTSSSIPVQVSNVTDFVQISVGNRAADDAICGVTKRGIAYCWGVDTSGQLGNGAGSAAQTVPGAVTNTAENFSKISVNDNTVCAITGERVTCWGKGNVGQIGNNASSDVNVPTFVYSITGIVDISTNTQSACAVEKTGNVWCWGGNGGVGNLGYGDVTGGNRDRPVLAKIMNAYKVSGAGQSFFALVDTSVQAPVSSYARSPKLAGTGEGTNGSHSCHIRQDGTMWCWGTEQYGELGNGGGATDVASTPVRVTDPGPWMSVNVSTDNTCGIKVDGSLWCWGDDGAGQLGNGATAGSQVSPSAVTSTIPWVSISISTGYPAMACGIKADGNAFCWGNDDLGNLGNGAGGNSNAPGTAIASTLPWTQISASGSTFGIKSDGTLWSWGGAAGGGLANGTTTPNLQNPAQIGTDTWQYVDVMSRCGIKTDGSLWCWGSDPNGQLGNGTSLTADQLTPSLVVEPGPWVSITGIQTKCGVKADGSGWCWGGGPYSIKGIGYDPGTDTLSPLPMAGNKDWVYINGNSTGAARCGVKLDDSIWCWGEDWFEALGNGTGGFSDQPMRIYQPYKSGFASADATTTTYAAATAANLAIGTTPLTNAEGTAQGLSFPGAGRTLLTQATTANQLMLETSPVGGSAQIWMNGNSLPYYMGYNAYTGGLEFGYGSDWLHTYTTASLEVSNEGFTGMGTGGAPVAKLDVRGAIKPGDAGGTCNGSVAGTLKYAGGAHTYCNGTTWVPFAASTPLIRTWDSISAGTSHSCGIKYDGTLWCWGLQDNGRLGNTLTSGDQTAPSQIGTAAWTSASSGAAHTCGIQSNATLWCWGLQTNGRLGNGSSAGDQTTPSQIGAANWTSISSGAAHTCGIQTNGTLWCWGLQTNGRLGDGVTAGNRTTPAQIGAANWTSISAGVTHTCGIQTNGTLWCWGLQTSGVLGNGVTAGDQSTPLQIGVANWSSISVGTTHTCGVQTNGTLWCWGLQTNGRLGNGVTAGNRTTPLQIGAATWTAISSANTHTCGMQTNGTIWCWGSQVNGRLGNGVTSGDQSTPVQVGAANWLLLDTGITHTCAVRDAGTSWCWGGAANGALGNGLITPDASTPWAIYP